MERHFTVSGFVVDGDATLLHFHRMGFWLPPGGHIDPDEDPVQAVVREVLEETGIVAEVVPSAPAFRFTNVAQLPPPMTILVADVEEGPHQHIDLVYALRPVDGEDVREPERDHGFIWVSEADLLANRPLPAAACGADICAPEDVRELGIAAIRLVRAQAAT